MRQTIALPQVCLPSIQCIYSDISFPATTVDVERAFSEGRREVNFMQTQMSHDTFNASMVVGSLAKLPSFDLKKAIDILENERFSD